jgi:periplasmic protein TonB
MPRDIIQMQREPFGAPAVGSLLLHAGVGAALAALIWVNGKVRGDQWSVAGPQGAIQATLVSNAPTIPLPSVTPPTPNVLATELPSPAPAPPSKASIPTQDEKAIPIPEREPKLTKEKPKETPKQDAPKHTQTSQVESPKHAQPNNLPNRANYGEAGATQLMHSMTNTTQRANTPVEVAGGDFAARFPWYVNMITRTVQQYWYRQEIDTSTSPNSVAGVTFTIARDGTVSNIRLVGPSPSPTLNTSGIRAVQRVEKFPPLPPQYTGSNVSVEYTFTYAQP